MLSDLRVGAIATVSGYWHTVQRRSSLVARIRLVRSDPLQLGQPPSIRNVRPSPTSQIVRLRIAFPDASLDAFA